MENEIKWDVVEAIQEWINENDVVEAKKEIKEIREESVDKKELENSVKKDRINENEVDEMFEDLFLN